MCGRCGVKEGAHREPGSTPPQRAKTARRGPRQGSEGARVQETPRLFQLRALRKIQGTKFARTDRAGRPGIVSFTGPLQLPYSSFTEMGVHWSHRASRSAGAVRGTRREGSGMKVYRRETGIRCRHALADSRGNRALVYGVGALELVEGRAAPGSWPDPIVRRFRRPSARLVMSATWAEPITVCHSTVRKNCEATGRRAASASA